jgi:hypothetical protein
MNCSFCGKYITNGVYCNDECYKKAIAAAKKKTGISIVWNLCDRKCDRFFCSNNKGGKGGYCDFMWGLCGAEQDIRMSKGEFIFRHSLSCRLLKTKISKKGTVGICPDCLEPVEAVEKTW